MSTYRVVNTLPDGTRHVLAEGRSLERASDLHDLLAKSGQTWALSVEKEEQA